MTRVKTTTLLLGTMLLLLAACSSTKLDINGLICPEDLSMNQVQKDLSQCRYYDEKRAAEASQSPIKVECRECLEEKGYRLED